MAKRIIPVLLLALVVALLFGVWLRSDAKNTSTYRFPKTLSKIAYGVNVDITAMIPGTPYTMRTTNGGNFFDLATQLGINTIRITDVQWTTTGQVRSQATWHYVFDEAEKHHINVILMLIDTDSDNKYQTALEEAHILLGHYGLAHAPALWMVDINNEPDLDDPLQMTELRKEAGYVHQVAPKVPVTIGGWKSEISRHPGQFDWQDPADIPNLINLVNVVSPHLYGFEQDGQRGITPGQSTRNFLAAVRQEAQGKPILLEEFGAVNGLPPTMQSDPNGSPQWQAYVYREVLQEVSAEHDQGIIGAVAWIFAPRPAPTDYNSDDGDMTSWAIVLNDGQRILPAAEVFSAVERGK